MVTVAALQIPCLPDNWAASCALVEEGIAEAAQRGARLVVASELTVCGSIYADAGAARLRAEAVDGPSVTFFATLARRYSIVLVAGFCEESGQAKPYNSAVVIDADGTVLAVYRKTHLWDFEKELFTPGDRLPPVVATAVGTVAPLICYDLAFPELWRNVTLRGAQLLASPANWPSGTGANIRPPEVGKAMAAAAINRVAVVVCDRVGTERGVGWVGGSVICDIDGHRVAGPHFGERKILVGDVNLGAALDKSLSERNHALDDRRLDLY